MKLKPEEHDWQQPFPNRKTTWICSRCGNLRKSKNKPPAFMLIAPAPGHKIGITPVQGPGPKSRTIMSCGEFQVKQVMDS